MHRTTILLPEELRRRANREAEVLGISLSELIRRRLASTLDQKGPERPRFFKREPWSGPGPSDVALRHDDHLYGP
jgi:hypothetical protein